MLGKGLSLLDSLTQRPLAVRYRGIDLDFGYRMDIVVENCVIIELKASEELMAVHDAQLLT